MNVECASLQYCLQHFQEISGGMDPSGSQNMMRQDTGGGAVSNLAEDEKTLSSKAAGMEVKLNPV